MPPKRREVPTKGPIYVVYAGRQVGFFAHWDQVKLRVNGYAGMLHDSATTLAEALYLWFRNCAATHGDFCVRPVNDPTNFVDIPSNFIAAMRAIQAEQENTKTSDLSEMFSQMKADDTLAVDDVPADLMREIYNAPSFPPVPPARGVASSSRAEMPSSSGKGKQRESRADERKGKNAVKGPSPYRFFVIDGEGVIYRSQRRAIAELTERDDEAVLRGFHDGNEATLHW